MKRVVRFYCASPWQGGNENATIHLHAKDKRDTMNLRVISYLLSSSAFLLLQFGWTSALVVPSQESFARRQKQPLFAASSADAEPCDTPSFVTSRFDFISQAASLSLVAASAGFLPSPANAKEVDPAVKGTKKDPQFEACLSQCMYECTKPKGTEQKSRAECLPECKKSCAVNKEQLMLGTPLKKD